MTAPPDFSGYRAHSEHPYRAHPFEPRKQQGPCLSCHREGHLAQNCPTWKGRCYRCHEAGHTSESCSLPDKRGRATRIIATDNRELARALANITKQLQEIKAQLKPNWAWRTLRPFRERTASHNRKPPEEPKPLEAQQPKPPEAQKQRTDFQGCDPPPHMHIGENMRTLSRLPPVSEWCIPGVKAWCTPTPEDYRQREEEYENSKNKEYDSWMILHTRDNAWLLKNFPKNPDTDPFNGAIAFVYVANFHDNMWRAKSHHPPHEPKPPDDEDDTRIQDQELQQDDYDNDYDNDYDYVNEIWRSHRETTAVHDHCPTGTDPFSRAIAMAYKATEPKPPTEQQQQLPKTRHAKHKRRKKT